MTPIVHDEESQGQKCSSSSFRRQSLGTFIQRYLYSAPFFADNWESLSLTSGLVERFELNSRTLTQYLNPAVWN